MNDLTIAQTREMFLALANAIVASEPFLTEVDLKIGDGDHGTGMELGFSAMREMLEQKAEFASVNDVFKESGMTLLDTMGGASGVLFGTLFISGVTVVEKSDRLTVRMLGDMMQKSVDSIKKRGKVDIGDKTMVDALAPAADALQQAAGMGCTIELALEQAALAAADGVEKTKGYLAKIGRAKSFREKSIGLQDAGATSVMILFRAMSDWVQSIA